MVLTVAAVADNKGMNPTRLTATVEGRTKFDSGQARTHFATQLDLGEDLTRREVRILYNSARQCEVHKMLRGDITFEEKLIT
jgi:uncharacterized OsmC-like protein